MKYVLCAILCLLWTSNLPVHAMQIHNGLQKQSQELQQGNMSAGMSSAFFGDLTMARDGSGTSWHPDSSPVNAIHRMVSGWNLMLHGSAYLHYTSQDVFDSGHRGGEKLAGPNWVMAMAHRSLGDNDQIMVRTMLLAEVLTAGTRGFPLLFQTGEAYDGKSLIDTQHPHDLFAELGVSYSHLYKEGRGFMLYFGFPGEPALGPPAFMHRPSARHIPQPPIAHHWQDATHVTFGVATFATRFRDLKFDASLFTGREPNQDRYSFDKPRFDSYSFRITLNPNDDLSVQLSRAVLKSPEALAPYQDQWRTTASMLYNYPFDKGIWTNTVVWGLNKPRAFVGPAINFSPLQKSIVHLKLAETFGPVPLSFRGQFHSILVESDLSVGKQAFFTRMEWVEKHPIDLGINNLNTDKVSVAASPWAAQGPLPP